MRKTSVAVTATPWVSSRRGGVTIRVRHFAAGALILLTVAFPSLVFGAELRLREALLQAQQDRVIATITAVVDHIGDQAHPLADG
jgi:hypothetical protein